MADSLLRVIMPAALFFIMMAMGMELSFADFKRVFIQPRAVLTGVLGQIFILPTFAVALVIALPLPEELAIGLVLLTACPGGAMSNVISYLARADYALAISMTAISSVLSVVSLPLLANVALSSFGEGKAAQIQLPIGLTMAQLALLTFIPVGMGMALHLRKPAFVARIIGGVNHAATVIFCLVVVLTFAANSDKLVEYVQSAVIHAFILGLAATFLGYGIARVVGLPPVQRVTIAVEFCIQNVAMATFVAINLLNHEGYGAFAGIYGIVCLLVILPAIAIYRRFTGFSRNDLAPPT